MYTHLSSDGIGNDVTTSALSQNNFLVAKQRVVMRSLAYGESYKFG